MPYPMTAVIAKRVLKRKDSEGKVSEIHVLIGQPMQRYDVDNNIQDWYCPIQILGMGNDKVQAIFGTDSMQALYLAMITAGQMLKASSIADKVDISWHDIPDYGLPLPDLKVPQSVLDKLKSMPEEERKKLRDLFGLH